MRQREEAAAERGQGPPKRRIADDCRETAACHKRLEIVFLAKDGIAGLTRSRRLLEESRAGDGPMMPAWRSTLRRAPARTCWWMIST